MNDRPGDESATRTTLAARWGIIEPMVAAASFSTEQHEAYQRRIDLVYHQVLRAHAIAEGMPEVAQTAAARIALLRSEIKADGDASPMLALARSLALSHEQCELVWNVVAGSFDSRLVPHLESLVGPGALQGLSVGAYAFLAELDDRHANDLASWLASGNLLVSTGLLKTNDHVSPAARPYVASSRLAAFLRGEEASIAPLRIVDANHALIYDRRQSASIQSIATVLARASTSVLVIEGPNGSGRATACACASGLPLLVLDCARTSVEHLAEELVVLRRETLLQGAIPALANVDQLLGDEQRSPKQMIGSFIDGTVGPMVITVTVPATDLGTDKPIVRLGWDVPDTETRRQLWLSAAHAAGAQVEGDLANLAFRYRVGPAVIARAVASVRVMRARDAALDETALATGLRHNIAERLGGLAKPIPINQTWDDLVLADEPRDLVTAVIGRIRDAHQVLDRWSFRTKLARGAGAAVLFSGPPGTGKTMVASLIARELDLELYQVDLSKVVSKWIGETEKNLARVFDAAEQGHALLLFDEADALFGARTADIKSANDRNANLEVNYLLQRVEAFGGITILTTNLDTAIEPALKRRLSGHIVFPHPEEDEREQIWERQLATGTAPLANDVDCAQLAALFPKMTGANIRNAAISAAFLAAGDKATRITQQHLIRAGRAEYQSMGHVLASGLGQRGPLRSP